MMGFSQNELCKMRLNHLDNRLKALRAIENNEWAYPLDIKRFASRFNLTSGEVEMIIWAHQNKQGGAK